LLVKSTFEKLENNMVKLDIEVDAAEFDKAVSSVFNKNKNAIAIPGFRKGKAPRKIVERFYGENVFHEDAFEALFPKVYYKTISENGFKPAAEPNDVDIEQIGNGQDLKFSLKVQLEPKPTLGEYKGVEVTKGSEDISENEVTEALSKLQAEHVRWVEKSDAASLGDRVTISYVGKINEEVSDLFSSENRTFNLGLDSYLKGFDANLTGMAVSEKKEFEFTLPEDFHANELAGKTIAFEVTMNEIKSRELPELDDEFAKDTSEFDSLELLKDSVKERLAKEKKEKLEHEVEIQILDKVASVSLVEIPENMIENRVKSMLHESDHRTQSLFGKTLQELDDIKYISIEEMKTSFRVEAERDIKIELVLDEIALVEGLKATEQEIEEKLPKGFPDSWKNYELTSNREINYLENLKEAITRKKVVDFLLEKAVIVNEEISADTSADELA